MSKPETPSNESIIGTLKQAAANLRKHGVPLGQEELIVGARLFEKMIHMPDVVDGRVDFIPTESPDRWLFVNYLTGDRFNVLISQDMNHWVNKGDDAQT